MSVTTMGGLQLGPIRRTLMEQRQDRDLDELLARAPAPYNGQSINTPENRDAIRRQFETIIAPYVASAIFDQRQEP